LSSSACTRSLASVAWVASTAMRPVRLAAAAGLMAGSTPTMGMGRCWRSAATAAVVAVLQATTSKAGALAVQVAADFQAALDDFGLAASTIGAVSLVSQIGNGPVRQGLHGTPDG
jgi:hypothetical protein